MTTVENTAETIHVNATRFVINHKEIKNFKGKPLMRANQKPNKNDNKRNQQRQKEKYIYVL